MTTGGDPAHGPTQVAGPGTARLAVERLGTGPTAVALHAGVADRRSWHELASALDGVLGLVAYDRRGFGDTAYDPEPHSHVDDLRAVLDAVAPEGRTWLVGSSQGGLIAIDFALEAPERVAGLVLIGTAVSGDDWADLELPPATAALDAQIEAADERGDLDEVGRLEAHLWLDGPAADEGRVGGAVRELFLDMNGRALRAADPGEELAPAGPPAAHRLGELVVPTLVVWGDLDLDHVIERSRQIAATVPGARSAEIGGTAHLPQLERPGAVAAAIAPWVDAVG